MFPTEKNVSLRLLTINWESRNHDWRTIFKRKGCLIAYIFLLQILWYTADMLLRTTRRGGSCVFERTLPIGPSSRFNNNRASATRKMGLCPGIEPGKFRANAADLPPGHGHMFPGCANGRGLGNYSTTGKWPAVEQDRPA